MQSVYDKLTKKGQARYNGIRRKVQFFSTFAGAVIEALRESGFRLCSFDKQEAHYDFPARRQLGQLPSRQCSNDNIELFFEQQDQDQCKVLIVPYRTDLPFLAKGRFVAQLGLELSRYCNDPETLRQAISVNAKSAFGGFLGGKRLPKLYLDSPPDIKPPGTMTFELRGARLVVSMNVLANLGKYRLSDFELDIDAIREDLEVYFYGLEKYLALLMRNFADAGVSLEAEADADPESAPAQTPEPPDEEIPPVYEACAAEGIAQEEPPIESASLPQRLPPSGTVRLSHLTPPPMAGAPLPQRLPPSGTVRLSPEMPPPGVPLPPQPPPSGTVRLRPEQ